MKKLVTLLLIRGARKKEKICTITINSVSSADNKVSLLPNKTLKYRNRNKLIESLTYHK